MKVFRFWIAAVVMSFLFASGVKIFADEGGKAKNEKHKVKLEKSDMQRRMKFLPRPPKGYRFKPLWQDTFSGKKIDTTKWSIRGDHKRKDGFWEKDNCFLDGAGKLVIRAAKEEKGYTTGCLSSKGKFEHDFGFYIIRCKFSRTQGHGPAFWLQSDSVGKVGDEGRDGTEIDILEKFKNDDRIQHALHWDGYGEDHKAASCTVEMEGLSSGYHTFGLLWTPTEYVFYVDGIESWRTTAGGVSQVKAYILLSDEIRFWNGDITKETFPQDFYVDYVRVYDLVPIKQESKITDETKK